MSDDSVFDAALDEVLRDEGGYVCDPRDPGGETNMGISRRTYPNEDIKGMTRERAAFLYRRDWWDHYGYGRLPPELAIKTMDLAVNVGAMHAHRLLQRALISLGAQLVEDGDLGPQTVAACSDFHPDQVLNSCRVEAENYYKAIVATHPQDAVYLRGWLRRADE